MRRPEATMSGLLGAQSRPNTLEVNRRRRRRVTGTCLIRPVLVQVDEGKGLSGAVWQPVFRPVFILTGRFGVILRFLLHTTSNLAQPPPYPRQAGLELV